MSKNTTPTGFKTSPFFSWSPRLRSDDNEKKRSPRHSPGSPHNTGIATRQSSPSLPDVAFAGRQRSPCSSNAGRVVRNKSYTTIRPLPGPAHSSPDLTAAALSSKISCESICSGQASSRASSISSRARRLLRLSDSEPRVTEILESDVYPTQEPRPGFVWFEEAPHEWRQIKEHKLRAARSRRHRSSEMSSASDSTVRRGSTAEDSSSETDQSSRGRLRAKDGRPGPSTLSKRSFYQRTKRKIRQQVERLPPSDGETDLDYVQGYPMSSVNMNTSTTRYILEKAASLLGEEQGRRQSESSGAPSPSGSSRDSASYRRHIHSDQRSPALSHTSSILKVIMGHPPSNTPNPEALYGGKNSTDYFKVEISDPDGPTFLPSEARRVNTPPLRETRPRSGAKRPRGFFFDYSNPGGQLLGSGEDQEGVPAPFVGKNLPDSGPPASPDWYRTCIEIEDSIEEEKQFDLNVPEHLPGSPLCPLSPLHKSGGKGICVYHGRRKTNSFE
ncbi:hypothetical protein L228DRAFT_66824 [Xylona heveae TC161]|uniref:Uncharacterized protein n=1 Tax=Xylona heveae (strain CBS 132557 / TC161) TaxID=1328760 RepID=A0A165ISN0_XYLHT|nr:hypothetical protein L228DRAFT_66824 [Xylona heveae TC161]KZF25328.1 hypothetical protein L228DRAFT_66824 [Xylona heveae TC161]